MLSRRILSSTLSRQNGQTRSQVMRVAGYATQKDHGSNADNASAIKFEFMVPFETHLLPEGDGPKQEAYATRDELLQYYKEMMRVRRMETAAGDLYKTKFVRGFCHLYSGQEAVCVGMEAAINKQDSIITSYRAHGFTLMRGAAVEGVLSELTGRTTGVSLGKGGSMHMYANEFYGGNGIVGAQVPLGAGVAFAHNYRKTDQVCISMYGDGAANQGQVFESFNMAKLWNLPCIFLCENNKYGMGTSIERSSASIDYYKRGDYIPGLKINGMDVLAVREGIRWAKKYAGIDKRGPLVLEVETYRYGGHSMSDPGTSYRTRDEVKKMRETMDPINQTKERLLENNLATAEELKEIDKAIKAEVDDAVKKAKDAPEPDLEETYTHIIKGEQYPVRGCDPFTIVTPRVT